MLYDIAIVGSGFAGSLMAMICQRLGRSVILLERGKHPRFTIGESSTPLTNLLLEELAARHDLPAIAPLAKWGTWQASYPDVACGLKRGFSFFHHVLGQPDVDDREHQLLVAASPNDRIADTHWYRPEFDHLFVKEAQKLGIEYREEAELAEISEGEEEVWLSGRGIQVRARFVIDASGPRGFLHRALGLPEAAIPDMPPTRALYSHFTGVGLYGDAVDAPPYPIDSAAVHHVFDGGWIWVLQFNNGVTSAGVAATSEAAERLRLQDGESAWMNLLNLLPRVKEQFANAQKTRPFAYVPQLSFRSGAVAGKRWVLLPSAAGFVDPLLSTGFAMTLLGVSRLSQVIEKDWGARDFSCQVRKVAERSDAELLAAARLIGSLYSSMSRFPVFASVSLLYFTAVIYSETVRRLGKPEMAQSFLLHDDAYFGSLCREFYGRVNKPDSKAFCDDIVRAIEPWNLAGLGDASRHNWYPVDARDLFDGAAKVGATREEISQLLARAGF
jgi:FADH2 O2-dependent halogenase